METPQKPQQDRPLIVTLIGIIAIAGGLFGLVGAIPVLLSSPTTLEIGLGSVVIIFSFLAFIVGTGLLRGMKWAWKFAVAFYALSIPLGIAETVAGGSAGLIGGAIRTVVGLIFLYFLTRPNVKSFFGKMPGVVGPAQSS